MEIGSVSAVLTLGKVLRVPSFQCTEVTVDFEALIEVEGHLLALGDLVGSIDSIIIDAVGEGSFVGETGELIMSLLMDEILYILQTRRVLPCT
jgi:hypothetical protein